MASPERGSPRPDRAPIYVISGGMGASGEHLVRTALAQFEDANLPVVVVPRVHQMSQVEDLVAQAAASGGAIVHTLVDTRLGARLSRRARQAGVRTVDLMGGLLSLLARTLNRKPLGEPGLYRKLREEYFDRIEAIEFTVAHDDGRNHHELHLAEVVLVGVSRVGKTPLSMYLSVMGWKVANVPLVSGLPPPEELSRIDPRRVVGLTIDPEQLRIHRRLRSRRMGVGTETGYTDLSELQEEVGASRRLCQRSGFPLVDVTDKPVEEAASEVLALVGRRMQERPDPRYPDKEVPP